MTFDNLDDYRAEQHLRYTGGNAQSLPGAEAQPDTEFSSRLDAERVTLQFARPSSRTPGDLEEGPLFDGPRQGRLF